MRRYVTHEVNTLQRTRGIIASANLPKVEFVFEAGAFMMRLVRGSYSCVSLVSGVGLVAFRDAWGIRSAHDDCWR